MFPVDTLRAWRRAGLAFVLALAFWTQPASTSLAAEKAYQAPAGVQVVSGPKFDIYVVQKESKPFADTGWTLNVFESVVVVHQGRGGLRRRSTMRVESIDGKLLEPVNWQVGDFDGDGLDDYRYVAQISPKGCRSWRTWLWNPASQRFTWGNEISHQTDAAGQPVKVCR